MTVKKILIIDDEDDIREVVKLTLEAISNWDVSTANSGTQGLIEAENQQPDAILLDVMMPDMDGITTFQKLQTIPAIQHIPVILMTAKVQAADKAKFTELGVTGVIPKPFNPMGLAEQIAEILGWS